MFIEQHNNQPKDEWISDPWNDTMESDNKQQLFVFSVRGESRLQRISNN